MLGVTAAVRDVLFGLSPWVPGQGRFRLDSVTAEELTAVIAANASGARIEAIQVQVDSRGTTDRARLHLTWNAAGEAAGLAPSVFAKATPSRTMARLVVSTFGCHTYETRFFQQIHSAVADLTITPCLSRSGRGGRYVLVSEDLALRAGVHFYDADDEAPLSHVEAVIDLLAKLHGRFWESPRFASDLAWLETYSKRPGSALVNQFLRLSAARFMKQDRVVPPPVQRLTTKFVEHHTQLVRYWESMPHTLCHGDCHLGNTYANPDGTAGIYDWQVLLKMNGLRDFAYFMTHSVPTELRRSQEKHLLARYLGGLAVAGAGREVPSFDDAFDAYRLLTINGWMAVVLTVAAGGMQPEDRVEVAATRAINTLLDLDVEAALTARL